MKVFNVQLQWLLLVLSASSLALTSQASSVYYKWEVKEAPYTRLCSTKNLLTVNGKFPGPTLNARVGDTLIVNVFNNATENITIHWHGVKQPRYPWSDGPEFITQCPIRPGTNFSQKIVLSDEVGTLWWHAHSDWSRATVHGLLVVKPKKGTKYPFPKQPDVEVPIILGEWWKSDIQEVLNEFLRTGGDPNVSDAFLINGQPGDLYPCSKPDTFKLNVVYGKTYLLRMVNAAMNNILFFSIANHPITLVGADGSYTKPLTRDFINISPGNTMDFLLVANQSPSHYYMAAKAYNSARRVRFDNTTTTGIIQYAGNYTPPSTPSFPNLPLFNDTQATFNFSTSIRSLSDVHANVPVNITNRMFFTVSINTLPCTSGSCTGPNGTRFAASVNNISFISPRIDILEAYYHNISDVYGVGFPKVPPLPFDYVGDLLPMALQRPDRATEVRVLEYNSEVEIIFQGTNLVAGIDHPMHLHGYSFYVVGTGFGNFSKKYDPLHYNLVDPPLMNTVYVPKNGWTTIRFKADNPGVWLMHCHLERHISWGMEMVFIVKNGRRRHQMIWPPPPDMPKC